MRRATVVAILLCVVPPAVSAASARTWIVPGVMNGAGGNGLTFTTEITVVNPGSTPAVATLLPIGPPGGPARDPLPIPLAPGEARLLPFDAGFPNGGALRISSDPEIIVFARIAAALPTASVGPPFPSPTRASALPVVDSDLLLRAGETGHSPWVIQSRDPFIGARTNVAVVFPDPTGGAATLTLYDDGGTGLGTLSYDVATAAFLQTRLDAFTSKDVPIGRIALRVTRGSACGYTGTVDNVSGDLAIVPTERPPFVPAEPGRVDLVSNGVAQIPGKNGSFWRTDARLTNPSGISVSLTAALLGPAGSSLPTALLTVASGQTVEIRDLVQSLFNISGPAAGAVLWRATGPLVVSTRTRSADSGPTVASVTVGAVPLSSFPTNLDSAAALADLRQDARFRTNLLAAAGPGGASFDLDLFDESGVLLETERENLPPLGWSQFPLGQLFSGVAIPSRSRLRARMQAGSATLQASVVDNFTNDPIAYEGIPRARDAVVGVPPVPAGAWGGAPNGMDHLVVDATSISIFRFCQSGTFPQPSSLDAEGRFSVIGTYAVQIGPSIQFDAILSGQTDGHTATVLVTSVGTGVGLLDTHPETFVLGAPFQPFTGLCPVEY